MIGALVSLVLISLVAAVVGQAIVAFATGADRSRPIGFSWLAPAVGLGGMLVLAGLTIRLPGHALTAGAFLAVSLITAIVYLRGRVTELGPALAVVAPALAVAVVAASLPFLIAGQVGILGVGLVNDDMASHLIIADYLADPTGAEPSFIKGGYPTGPHAIVAAIAEGTGFGLVEVWAGFSLALAAMLTLAGLGVLHDLPLPRRILGACLIALVYLASAYLSQGAFKEPLMALKLLGFGLWLAMLMGFREAARDGEREISEGGFEPPADVHPLRRVLPLIVIAAGVIFAYSLPGLLWVAAVAVAVIAAGMLWLEPRPRLPQGWLRRSLPYAAAALALLVAFTVLEWDRISNFTRFEALSPDRFGSQLGNLAQSLNPLEVLGIWPSSEFDATPASAGLPAPLFYIGAAIGLAAFVAGLASAFRSRRLALPAAAIAALAVWALLAVIASPYVAAKGLAIAAPLVIAVSLRGTLSARGPLLALAVSLVLGAGLSSFLVLRAAAVGPASHANQLAEIAEKVQGEDVLFLGRDDFIGWELAGSGEITGVVTNFYDVEDAKPRFKKGEGGGEKFDVDVLFPRQLDRFRFVLATSGGPASSVPPRFEVVAETPDYVLYERTGATGRRRTLDEGTAVGAVLNCESENGREIVRGGGVATIWDPPPVIGETDDWAPDDEPTDGSPSTLELELPTAGEWLISLEYDSRRPVRVTAPAVDLDVTMAANLDFRGETPTFPVGEITVDDPGPVEFTVEPEQPNLLARLLRAPNEAHLRSLTATPLDPAAIRRVPIREACGSYVDWYRAG